MYRCDHDVANEETCTTKTQDDTRPEIQLSGTDGNAFSVIGKCMKAARKAGWSKEKQNKVREEMTSGGCDNVLATAMKYFDVE